MSSVGSTACVVTTSMYGQTNTLQYNNKIYSTLADVTISSTTSLCQSDWISMPSGWAIAPDNTDTVALSTLYPWSTDVLTVSSGVGYRTTNFPPAGQAFGDSQSKYVQSGNQYKCPWCNYQILVIYTGGDIFFYIRMFYFLFYDFMIVFFFSVICFAL